MPKHHRLNPVIPIKQNIKQLKIDTDQFEDVIDYIDSDSNDNNVVRLAKQMATLLLPAITEVVTKAIESSSVDKPSFKRANAMRVFKTKTYVRKIAKYKDVNITDDLTKLRLKLKYYLKKQDVINKVY